MIQTLNSLFLIFDSLLSLSPVNTEFCWLNFWSFSKILLSLYRKSTCLNYSSIMTRFQKENMKIRVLRLISLKGTGTTEELAIVVDGNIRSVKRLIHELGQEGYMIRYCRTRRSYVPA